MDKEEKEAIEILKLYFGDNPTLNITKYVNIVLNLIEKQSKEIEELKEDNKHQWEERCKLTFELKNSTSNDKIKAKIEELIKEGNYRTADNPNGRVHFQKEIIDYQIKVLQSLLDKE